MGELIVHGDAEALIIKILKESPQLSAYNSRISSDLRGYSANKRWITVTAEGGAYSQYNVINKPRIDLEIRGERRTIAHDMTQIALAAIFAAVPSSDFGATLSEVLLELGPVNVPDKEEEASYRYIASVRCTCLPHPASAPGAPS